MFPFASSEGKIETNVAKVRGKFPKFYIIEGYEVYDLISFHGNSVKVGGRDDTNNKTLDIQWFIFRKIVAALCGSYEESFISALSMQGWGKERSSVEEWSLETTSIHAAAASYEIWGKPWTLVLH